MVTKVTFLLSRARDMMGHASNQASDQMIDPGGQLLPAAEAGVIGLAVASRDRVIHQKAGPLADWLPPVGTDCCASIVLSGMEAEFTSLADGRRGPIALPGIRGTWLGHDGQVTASVSWDAGHDRFIILTVPDFTAQQLEALIGSERRARRLIEQQLEAANSEARFASVARTRLRLARDLHDTLVHSIMALLTQIRLLQHFATKAPERVSEGLKVAEEAAISGLGRARDVIARLRLPDDLDPAPGLEEIVMHFAQRSGLKVTTRIDPRARHGLRQREMAIGRILTEALRNVEAHAHARHVVIRASEQSTDTGLQIVIDIRDDGRGFDPATVPAGHFGLVGMAEFAGLAGGTCSVESFPGGGTTVRVTLPAAEPAEDDGAHEPGDTAGTSG